MSITISKKTSRDKLKYWYYEEWGKEAGQRRATGIFTYVKPVSQIQKNHNKETLAILQIKQSQLTSSVQGTYPSTNSNKIFWIFLKNMLKLIPSLVKGTFKVVSLTSKLL